MYDNYNHCPAWERMETIPYTPKDSRIVETTPHPIELIIHTNRDFSGLD